MNSVKKIIDIYDIVTLHNPNFIPNNDCPIINSLVSRINLNM